MIQLCDIPGSACAPCDFPLLNLTSENEDKEIFIGIAFEPNPPILPPHLGLRWTSEGCLTICESILSQSDADLCAQRQNAFCTITPPIIGLVSNTPQSCTVNCPDGSPFTYTVPAGLFVGENQNAVNAQAHSYACTQARIQLLCFSNLAACTCVGTAFSQTVTVTGVARPLTYSVTSGSLPPGLNLVPGAMRFTVSGTATTAGTYPFTIQAIDGNGNFMRKPFLISVIQVTTTSLPPFTPGIAYIAQLAAIGGSGQFQWRIASGTLPDGLVLDVTGLIHGTPTGSTSGTALTFEVIDLVCENSNKSFFPPRVALTTKSKTTIATVLGYPEFLPSGGPPKKYHDLTWSAADDVNQMGTSNQQIHAAGNESISVGAAKIEWEGTGEIDAIGNQVSNYRKDYFAQCDKLFTPSIGSTIGIPPSNIALGVQGYCWPTDSESCPVCDPTLPFVKSIAGNSGNDGTVFLDEPSGHNTTPTTSSNVSSSRFIVALRWDPPAVQPPDFPVSVLNGILAPWVVVDATNNYLATLSNEYTDAEALSNALIINSNGSTAQTLARTTGYVSTWTTVNFTLTFTNLVVGEAYVGSVTFVDSNAVKTVRSYGFIADAVTHVINDAVPTPVQGHTISVRFPTAAFAP